MFRVRIKGMFFGRRRFRVSTIGRRRRVEATAQGPRISWAKLLGLTLFGAVSVFLLRKYVVLLILNIFAFIFTPILPSVDNTYALFANQSTIIYDRAGNELYTIHGDENRFEIPLAKMPDSVKLATLAAEDDRFYEHSGFDVDAMLMAVLSEVGIGRPRGGSTITQQFVKNAYLSPERTYLRKIKELLMAIKLENNFTKDEILEMYLNRIPYGSNAYGVEAAAQTFFGKHASELSLAESAILASLPQAPTKYSPYGSNRGDLLGVCTATPEELSLDSSLTLSLEFTAPTWVTATADGIQVKKWTAKAGEKIDLPFTESFSLLTGSDTFTARVAELTLPVPPGKKGVKLAYTKTAIETLAHEAGLLTKKVECSSPEDPRYTPGRKDYVLNRMLKLGLITEADYTAAWHAAFDVQFEKYREPIKHPHFVMYVRDKLEEQYGKELVERGGLRVYTTLDPDLQQKAEDLITNHFPHTANPDGTVTWKPDYGDATNAALLSVDVKNGQILAMVGSRDYFEKPNDKGLGNDGAVNLTVRPRQPGSSFKPIVYATGFLGDYAPGSILWDVETDFGGEYKPKNFDGTSWGPVSIRRALQGSRNVPAVKMAALVSEKAVVALAQKLGITTLETNESYGPSIGLGAGSVEMVELLSAYTAFAHDGRIAPLTPFLKITDSKGNSIEEFTEPKNLPQVLDPNVAYLVADVLSDTSARPAGWNSFLSLPDRPVLAKTGTANRRFGKEKNDVLPGDIWTFGATPQIATGVWLGRNDSSPMNIRAEGLTVAGPIWRDFMKYAHAKLPAENFVVPDTIVAKSINRRTGKLPSDRTPAGDIVTEKFAPWNVPLAVDDGYIKLKVDRVSGKLPTEFTPPEAIVDRIFINLHSERPNDPYWEDPVRRWVTHYKSEDGSDVEIAYGFPPTTYDDVHTASAIASAPRVAFVSPKNSATVRAGAIGVWVDVTGSNGIDHVEYYRGTELLTTVASAPWKGTLTLSGNPGEQVIITAKAYDKLGYTGSAEITVTLGVDDTPPFVRFLTPTAGSTVAVGSELAISLEAYDRGGDVTSVTLSLDGKVITDFKNPPYEFTVPTKSLAAGTHTLHAIATDTDGRTTEGVASFEVTVAKPQ